MVKVGVKKVKATNIWGLLDYNVKTYFLYKICMTCSKSSNSNWIDGLLI
jgi:hypothetical protein